MTKYIIFIRSNEHPRTINTPMMARTNYTAYRVVGRAALEEKVAELRVAGEVISEIRTNLGARIWL